MRNSLVKLVHYAHNPATRWCAISIKCAPVAHARATRPAMNAGAFERRTNAMRRAAGSLQTALALRSSQERPDKRWRKCTPGLYWSS